MLRSGGCRISRIGNRDVFTIPYGGGVLHEELADPLRSVKPAIPKSRYVAVAVSSRDHLFRRQWEQLEILSRRHAMARARCAA